MGAIGWSHVCRRCAGGVAVTAPANPYRGEASLRMGGAELVLRPSFAALVAAEAELGPLLPLVERAGQGELRLEEIAVLFWHCLHDRPATCSREAVGEAVLRQGLAAVMPALRVLLRQVVLGAG